MIDRRVILTALGSGMTTLAAGRLAAASGNPMSESSAPETGSTTAGAVDVLGGRLSYLSAGQGDTLVLLHKLGGRRQEWRRVLPALAGDYRVIALDLAGHGESDMHGPPPFIVTQEALAAQVMGALDSLELPPPYRFVGSSSGGCIAIVCAALWPERVAGVVSLGSALAGGSSRVQLRETAAQAIANGQFDADENPLPRPLSYATSVFGIQDAAIAREQNESRAQAGRWIAPVSRGVGRLNFLALLPRVAAPVLLAWGERGTDRHQALAGGNYGRFVEPALARLARGEKHLIGASGAFPHEEAPAATAAAVLSFLRRSPA
jgi:3-oxoadipate enol-lactonase